MIKYSRVEIIKNDRKKQKKRKITEMNNKEFMHRLNFKQFEYS